MPTIVPKKPYTHSADDSVAAFLIDEGAATSMPPVALQSNDLPSASPPRGITRNRGTSFAAAARESRDEAS